jgi:hypothetical protein
LASSHHAARDPPSLDRSALGYAGAPRYASAISGDTIANWTIVKALSSFMKSITEVI